MVQTDSLGLILAGGKSSRMGQDKRFIHYQGRTLLEHVETRLSQQVSQILVSANDQMNHPHPVVSDGQWIDSGPLAGILAGLEWAKSHCFREVLTVPVDAPLLPLNLMQRLYENRRDEDQVTTVIRDGKLHPVFGLWRTDSIDEIVGFLSSGQRSLRYLIRELPHSIVEFEGTDSDPFTNINTPEDLDQLKIL